MLFGAGLAFPLDFDYFWYVVQVRPKDVQLVINLEILLAKATHEYGYSPKRSSQCVPRDNGRCPDKRG